MLWYIQRIYDAGDYYFAYVPEHPNSNYNGYVLLHRAIVENYLGRVLDTNEVVHHKNGNKKDNRTENLQVMTNEEHVKLHNSEIGRQFVTLKCPNCGKIFERDKRNSFLDRPNSAFHCSFCSRSCAGKFAYKVQKYGYTKELRKRVNENLIEIFRKYEDYFPNADNVIDMEKYLEQFKGIEIAHKVK